MIKAQSEDVLLSPRTHRLRRQGDLGKRGSLQSNSRMSINRGATYSVPSFLELAPRSGVSEVGGLIDNKRKSVIIYAERGGKQAVRAGTLDALIDVLTAGGGGNYVEAFIATHTYFVDSQTLMTRLMERFYEGEEQVVIEVFRKWVETYVEDFTEEPLLFFNMFISDLRCKGFEILGIELREHLNKQQAIEIMREEQRSKQSAEDSMRDRSERSILERVPGFTHKTFAPTDIAMQLTLVERDLFIQIPLRQYLNKAWSSKDKGKAPELGRFIQRSNDASFWVATSILCVSDNSKKREKMIGLFIEVALACLQLQNFQTAMQIFSGLILTPIQRLASEWKSLPKKHKEGWGELTSFFDQTGNFNKYRTRLKSVSPPAIPLLSLILSDLTFIEENDNEVKHEQQETTMQLIHFEKMMMIHDTLSILKKNLIPYHVQNGEKQQPKEDLLRMVTILPCLPEKELYEFKGSEGKKKVLALKKEWIAAAKLEKKKAATKL